MTEHEDTGVRQEDDTVRWGYILGVTGLTLVLVFVAVLVTSLELRGRGGGAIPEKDVPQPSTLWFRLFPSPTGGADHIVTFEEERAADSYQREVKKREEEGNETATPPSTDTLERYAWVDRTAGLVSIPVEQAMRIVIAEGARR